MNGIFDTRAGTIYDDDIRLRYHFPNRYLNTVQACLDDWIVYREPRRENGRAGYIAVARVDAIEPDRESDGHSYARMREFLEFDQVIPLDSPTGPYEALLRGVMPARRGVTLQGKSVRTIDTIDFAAIVAAGFSQTLIPEEAQFLVAVAREVRALDNPPPIERTRRIEQTLVNRTIRDAAFRRQVINAYDGRCALTGLRLVDSSGNAEAQAAHIWPVADNGPDIVQNGIALSGTIHWLFDRHLISLTDELGLLVANSVPAELRRLLELQIDRILLPANAADHPHLDYVRRHRARFREVGY